MKHLRLFPNAQVRDSVLADIDYKILSKTEGEPGVSIQQGTWINPKTIPFYIEDISGSENTIQISKSGINAPTITIEKSLDSKTWTLMGETSTTPITATIPANGKLYLRCNTSAWGKTAMSNTINATGNCNVGGNIMSLLYGNNFTGKETTFPDIPSISSQNFSLLFDNNIYLVDASELILPATTLTIGCYNSMFQNCTSLTTAPELPATTLAGACYSNMFNGCTSLTTAPALPATTLAVNCYNGMFQGCTSLTTAPALPATILATYCYQRMFQGCSSLTTAPTLPATTLAMSCYNSMFQGCSSLTTAPELPATTLAGGCYQRMFFGCKSLTTAPALPAETLAENCYYSMFQSCSALTTAPSILPATTLASYCYNSMFYGCTALTTTPELPATTLTQYCYMGMFQNCRNINHIKCLATDISASGCLNNWTFNVQATGTFVKAASMTDWPTGVNGIPEGWTVEDAA